MPSTYHQVYDSDWQEVPKEWILGCCDCGLVHVFNFRIKKKGALRTLEVQVLRDDRRTGQIRRYKGVRVVATRPKKKASK